MSRASIGGRLGTSILLGAAAPPRPAGESEVLVNGIARAVAVQPEVLLLDEPCASIDPVSSAKFEQTIVELRPDHATVLVTHDPQAVVRVSDSVGFRHPGEMLEFGTVRVVRAPMAARTKRIVTVGLADRQPGTSRPIEVRNVATERNHFEEAKKPVRNKHRLIVQATKWRSETPGG